MSKWQPIETAPMDGSEILIFAQNMAIQARFLPGEWASHHEYGEEYSGAVWCAFDDLTEFEIEETDPPHHGCVTHWQPLPDPPGDT